MSLSSLVSATESAVRLSEAAVAAAEEAMAASRLASIHANSALAAARLALDLESRISVASASTSVTPSVSERVLKSDTEEEQEAADDRNEHEESPDETIEQFMNIDIDRPNVDENDNTSKLKKKKNICCNCHRYKTVCLDGKFLLKVIKKTVGMKVVGWLGPPHLVGRVGTVVGGTDGNVVIRWDSNKQEKDHSYSLYSQGKFAFKFFCQDIEPKDESPADEVKDEKATRPESDRKLYVGGLDQSVTDDCLKVHFEKFGKLTDWVVMKTSFTNKSKGYGFVTFLEPKTMERCLQSQPHYLDGELVELKRVTPKPGNKGPTTENSGGANKKLYVSGLDPGVTKEDLREYFEMFGKLTDWVVMIGPNAVSKCSGFVTFKSALTAEKCLKSRPHYLKGKAIDLKPAYSQYPRDSCQDGNFSNKWLCALRLPSKDEEILVWRHDIGGEKHRIRFCASENISMTGIGLLVRSVIKRVTFNLCQETDRPGNDHSVIFKQDFENVSSSSVSSIVLKLRHGVELSSDRIYLLVLTMYGGASYVGVGGEEFIGVSCGGGEEEVLFKFEDYHHRTDKPHQVTDVERGLVEKIYFDL